MGPDKVFQPRDRGWKMRRLVSEHLMSDQNPGATVSENDCEVFGSEPEIQRHEDEAEMSCCEIGFEKDVTIFMENGDTVLSAKSHRAETITKAPNPFAEVPIAHSHVPTNHCLPIRIKLDSLWKKFIQRHSLIPPQ
jgi:hypothetical protein